MNPSPALFVTGASGQLGRQTVEFLLASNRGRVFAGTRDPQKIEGLVGAGATARVVDFDRPETLSAAFEGIDRLLIISTDSLDRPGRRIAQHQSAIDAAVSAGVKHLIYTSVTRAAPDSAAAVTLDHCRTEQAIIASGLGYTILRNTLYADNLLAAIPQILASGTWYHAAAEGRISRVTRSDCARIAAAALQDSFEGKRILEVTGPDLLNTSETAALLGGISGQHVAAVPVDEGSLVNGLVQAGIPEVFARILASFDIAQAKGEFDIRSSAIRDLTGREPESLRAFLSAALRRSI